MWFITINLQSCFLVEIFHFHLDEAEWGRSEKKNVGGKEEIKKEREEGRAVGSGSENHFTSGAGWYFSLCGDGGMKPGEKRTGKSEKERGGRSGEGCRRWTRPVEEPWTRAEFTTWRILFLWSLWSYSRMGLGGITESWDRKEER